MLKKEQKIDIRYHEPRATEVRQLYAVYSLLAKYHQYRVQGLQNIPQSGRCLVVVNHSLATYDCGLLCRAIYQHNGRILRGLSDCHLFSLPALGRFCGRTGLVPAQPNIAEYLLNADECVLVAPGGMREALRSSKQKYTVRWQSRQGFVRLAIKTQTPIVLSACPAADDIFTVYGNALTQWVYQHAHLPLPMMRGLGPSCLPRPVKLVHYLSQPIFPPEVDTQDNQAFNRAVDHWHRQLTIKMQSLLARHCS